MNANIDPTYATEQAAIYTGNCLDTLRALPSGIAHCCITSPPYFGLRDYGHAGQIGLESTVERYVEGLVEVFAEVGRVLRPDATLWLNLGDSYNGSGGAGGDYAPGGLKDGQPKFPGRKVEGLKPKDLIGVPWRVAFALQAAGWYLRADVIWHKPSAMPESATDRPTRNHEYIFLLSKSPKYFYDHIAILEPHSGHMTDHRINKGWEEMGQKRDHLESNGTWGRGGFPKPLNPAGRNKRSVWTVTTKPYKEAHFAPFPPDLVEPMILAGTSAAGCCRNCGSPLRRPTAPAVEWEPTCHCFEEAEPCSVLDPFMGTATTGQVALQHGRRFIGMELNRIMWKWRSGGFLEQRLDWGLPYETTNGGGYVAGSRNGDIFGIDDNGGSGGAL